MRNKKRNKEKTVNTFIHFTSLLYKIFHTAFLIIKLGAEWGNKLYFVYFLSHSLSPLQYFVVRLNPPLHVFFLSLVDITTHTRLLRDCLLNFALRIPRYPLTCKHMLLALFVIVHESPSLGEAK